MMTEGCLVRVMMKSTAFLTLYSALANEIKHLKTLIKP